MSFTKQKGSNKRSGICQLAANNDMTIYSAAMNHESLGEFFSDFKTFYVDLSQVEEMDTSGVQILLSLSCTAKQQDKAVYMHSPSNAVNEVFSTLNVTDLFEWNQLEAAS